jgi:uncharacterized protein (TIGR03435 family)
MSQLRSLAVFLFGVIAFAQQPSKLEFEVASIKPVNQPMGRTIIGSRGGPGTPDPTRVEYMGLPLKALITMAYDIKQYQLTGPAWLDDPQTRFDITARVPEGAAKDDVKIMLQNLLADRFKLTVHHETKDLPLYELTVGKNGHKMKSSVEDPDASKQQGPPPLDKDGRPQIVPGRPAMLMMMRPGGIRMTGGVRTMTDLANALSNMVGSSVVDKTGLPGTYDFVLEFAPEPGQGGIFGGPLLPPPPPPPAGAAGPGAGPETAGPNNQTDLANLFTAIQEQLGLKLDKKKGPLDTVVVDRLERTPTEN